MDEKPPDLISRIATYVPMALVPLWIWYMRGWKGLAIVFGMAFLVGILVAYFARNETDEDDFTHSDNSPV